jgi:hypothetical protein
LLSRASTSVLDARFGAEPDPDELVQAAMEWHFNSDTGFELLAGARHVAGLRPEGRRPELPGPFPVSRHHRRFPDTTAELRDVSATDLIPRGYGRDPDVIAMVRAACATPSTSTRAG